MRPLGLLALLLPFCAAAQEFNCQVSVIAPQIAQAQTGVFRSMETAIKEFFNTRRFTNYNYAPQERIDINLLLTINN
ncbi:MAG: DUF4835 family protein, partial [Flavobacteriales bacterium]